MNFSDFDEGFASEERTTIKKKVNSTIKHPVKCPSSSCSPTNDTSREVNKKRRRTATPTTGKRICVFFPSTTQALYIM